MLFFKDLASVSLATLLLQSSASAAPSNDLPLLDRRDDSSNIVNSTATNETTTSLEPVVPPAVDPEDLSILSLDKSVTLAWAGSPTEPGSKRMLKRSDGIFSQANFTFKYPTVPLDHSDFITDITCQIGSLTAKLSNSAYKFAKKEWKGTVPIIFVTAVDGCGDDNENEFFIVKSIDFSDGDKTFTSKGVSAGYRDVTTHFNLKWGTVGTLKLRRSIEKRDMFEPLNLHRRGSTDFDVGWDIKLNDIFGTDPNAPWDNAAMLYKWTKNEGVKDITMSWAKGQVADPKNPTKPIKNNPTKPLAESDFGLGMYCVECGFGGYSTIHGEIDARPQLWSPFIKVNKVQTRFDATFRAGINLGMEAYVKYEGKYSKKYDTDIQKIPLSGFNIPKLALLGPFVSLSIEAKATIKATGALLMGSTVNWENIDAQIDLLDSSNSYANNMVPSFTSDAKAAGEVRAEASLGMPLKLGVGISLLNDLWFAEAVIKNTPAVALGAGFKASAGTSTGIDVNGGCYGVAWDVTFKNSLQAVAEVRGWSPAEYDLIEPMGSKPIAEGCIGYKKPSQSTCSTSDVVLNPETSSAQSCKKTVVMKRIASKNLIGTATVVKDDAACAAKCFKEKKCLSFSLSKKKSCQLYNSSYKSISMAPLPEQPTMVFNDKQCYAYKKCP
ncbi:hypothetical protein NW762_010383 [Fusarium torreyae]|uniref:Apple domain-containing protein n=1 Tax=Fusarium torreyae TaxID=1237075 RepID=A0A9W8RW55_9HYPO|nr:hypothetical protein NW762_010383 [Fusarium torreyae]